MVAPADLAFCEILTPHGDFVRERTSRTGLSLGEEQLFRIALEGREKFRAFFSYGDHIAMP